MKQSETDSLSLSSAQIISTAHYAHGRQKRFFESQLKKMNSHTLESEFILMSALGSFRMKVITNSDPLRKTHGH
jgi:hypothetical protein